MGQRLVINFLHENKRIANIYYHWSGYTASALYALANFKERFDATNGIPVNNPDGEDDILLHTLRALTTISNEQKKTNNMLMQSSNTFASIFVDNGARISPKDSKALSERYPDEYFGDPADTNRNNGLICITEPQMEDSMSWAEADATVDLDRMRIEFNVFYCMEDDDDDDFISDNPYTPTVQEVDFDLSDMTFDNVTWLIGRIEAGDRDIDALHQSMYPESPVLHFIR